MDQVCTAAFFSVPLGAAYFSNKLALFDLSGLAIKTSSRIYEAFLTLRSLCYYYSLFDSVGSGFGGYREDKEGEREMKEWASRVLQV